MNKTGIAYGNVWAEAYGNVVVVHVAAVGPRSNHGAWTSWKFGQLPHGLEYFSGDTESQPAIAEAYDALALATTVRNDCRQCDMAVLTVECPSATAMSSMAAPCSSEMVAQLWRRQVIGTCGRP